MSVKYEDQCRISAGVCVKMNDDHQPIGHRLPLFNYSGKELIGVTRSDELISNEINRVKNLPNS